MATEQENIEFRKLFLKQVSAVHPIWQIDALLFIVALIGLALNALLLLVACRRKKPWAVDVMLISVVASFDILWCSTLIISLITRWSIGDSVLEESSSWCKFSAIAFNSSFVSATVCTAVLAVARYLAIVRKLHLSNRLCMGLSLILVLIVWSLFIQRGFTEIIFVMPAGIYCFPQIFGSDWATKFFDYFIQILVYPSFLLIPICYILMTFYYRRQLVLLHSSKNQRLLNRLNRDTLSLIAILLAYSIAIFPDPIHIIISLCYDVKRTPLSDGIVMGLEFCVSSINAIFALLMHEEISFEFKKLLGIPNRHQSFPSEG